MVYRSECGRPDAVGCLLPYLMLRHNSMISKENIKTACDSLKIDASYGWRQVMHNIPNIECRIRLQRWPNVPKSPSTSTRNKEELKDVEDKFDDVCKSLLQRVEERKKSGPTKLVI